MGRTHYTSLMAMLGSTCQAATPPRTATAEELVNELHLQYRIMGQNTGKFGNDDYVVKKVLSNF